MAWIESHAELRDHPKTDRLIELLGLTRRDAVGLLHFIWWRALTYAPDGCLGALTDGQIARWAEWDREPSELVAALTTAGFLDEQRILHDWRDYAGRWIERRRADAERKRRTSSGPPKDVRRNSAGPRPDSGVTGPDLTGPDLTGPDEGRASARPAATATPLPANAGHDDVDDVPAPVAGFHAVLVGTQGYEPSPAFFEQVTERYGSLDLREEALKIRSWLADPAQNRRHKSATTNFILGWLKRELDSRTAPALATNGAGHAPGWAGAPSHPAPVKVEEF